MAIRVKSRGGESVEGLMRRFKKLCEKEGLTKDIKRKEFYEKPSERRRRAMRKSQVRRIKTELGPMAKPDKPETRARDSWLGYPVSPRRDGPFVPAAFLSQAVRPCRRHGPPRTQTNVHGRPGRPESAPSQVRPRKTRRRFPSC